MARNREGYEPNRLNRRVDHTTLFGHTENKRSLLWATIRALSERGEGGADWNDVLDEAEKRGIDRLWAHGEIKRRLRWGDVHLFNGNLHPHYTRRCHAGLWYSVMRSESGSADLTGLDTCLDNKEAIQRSLWRILSQHSGRHGARINEVFDAVEQYGMDRFWVYEMLVFWDGRDDITLSRDGNRAELEREDWRP